MRPGLRLKTTGIALSFFVFMGCGDDTSSTVDAPVDMAVTPDGGASDGVGSDMASTQCRGTFAALNRAQLAGATRPNGMCAMPADLDIICGNDVGLTTRTCGQTCFLMNPEEAAVIACTTMCVKVALNPDLTDPCLGCYATAVSCTLKNCAAVCAADPNGQPCLQCQTTNGCLPGFFGCSGLPAPMAPGGGDAGVPEGGSSDDGGGAGGG